MMTAILGNTGYFVGIGIEVFVILICGVLLVLMLTGLLFKWLENSKVTNVVKAEAKAAAAEARAVVEEEAAAQAAADAEAAKATREADAVVKAEAEAAAAEAAAVAKEKAAEEAAAKAAAEKEENAKLAAEKAAAKAAEAKAAEEAKATEEVTEKVVVKETVVERTVVQETAETEAAAAEAEEGEDGDRDFVVVHDGIVFNDSKTITELYEELSPEQQSYFDELREEALTKPDAELAISKNFITVKIGKRNLIKLLIKRGVTVAEFMLENDALKQLRLSNTNKRGKSSIKVKPTVVQVLDLASLKVAVDMINLSYEELMLGD